MNIIAILTIMVEFYPNILIESTSTPKHHHNYNKHQNHHDHHHHRKGDIDETIFGKKHHHHHHNHPYYSLSPSNSLFDYDDVKFWDKLHTTRKVHKGGFKKRSKSEQEGELFQQSRSIVLGDSGDDEKHIIRPDQDAKIEKVDNQLVEGRSSNSPVVAYLTAPKVYDPRGILEKRFKYCDGDTYLAGFEVMPYYRREGDISDTVHPRVTRVAMHCETIQGEHTKNIYAGKGTEGRFYDYHERLNAISNRVDIGYSSVRNDIPGWSPDSGDCRSTTIRNISLYGLSRNGNKIKFVIKELPTRKDLDFNVKYQCPPGSALCGIRARETHPDKMCGVCWCAGNIQELDFACCKVPLPLDTCDAGYNWETTLSCRENIKCLVVYVSTFGESNLHSTKTDREIQDGGSLGLTAGVNFAEFFQAKVTASIGLQQVHGRTIANIVESIQTTTEVFTIDLADCVGSLQQLVITCGIYEATSKQFRCQPYSADDL